LDTPDPYDDWDNEDADAAELKKFLEEEVDSTSSFTSDAKTTYSSSSLFEDKETKALSSSSYSSSPPIKIELVEATEISLKLPLASLPGNHILEISIGDSIGDPLVLCNRERCGLQRTNGSPIHLAIVCLPCVGIVTEDIPKSATSQRTPKSSGIIQSARQPSSRMEDMRSPTSAKRFSLPTALSITPDLEPTPQRSQSSSFLAGIFTSL
jgi:hypothetical protein